MYAYMALCYSWHVPEDADLVFVEYAVNDQPPTDGKEYPMPQLAALEVRREACGTGRRRTDHCNSG